MIPSTLVHLLQILLLMLITLTGCVTPQTDYVHRSFNYHSIQEDGLAIVGMVDAKKRSRDFHYLDLSRQLENAVVNAHPDYPIIAAKQTKKALGKNYVTVLDGYQKLNEVGIAELDLLRRAPIVARFGLFARIERDAIERPPAYERPVLDSNGKVIENRVEEVLTSRRVLTVSAKVYDLKNGRLVWQKLREVAPQNENIYVKYDGSSFAGALTIATLNTVQNGSLSKKPPAYPDRESAMQALLRDVASRIPGLPAKTEPRFTP